MFQIKTNRSLLFLIFTIFLSACQTSKVPVTKTVILTATVQVFQATATKADPTAIPVKPEIKAALGDAPFTVAPDGNAVIVEKDTNQSVEIVRAVDVKTNDGLAKDIKTGYDKDNNRFIYVENYGWVKDIDLSTATVESPLEISWELASHQETLNTIFALHYAENPTISPNAVEPHYWINVDGSNNIYLGFQSIGASSLIYPPYGNPGKLDTKFNNSDKFFTQFKILQSTNPQGQKFAILGGTFKNPTKENKDQLINLFDWMGKARFDELVNLPANYMMNMTNLINNNTLDIAPVLAPPATANGIPIPWDPSAWKDSAKRSDPAVAGLQKPGELLSLFTNQEQQDILKIIAFFHGGPIFEDGHTASILVEKIPEGFALRPLLINLETWGYPPGK